MPWFGGSTIVRLMGDDAHLQGTLSRGTRMVRGFAQSARRLLMMGGLGGAGLGAGMVLFGKSAVRAAADAERASMMLAANLKNVKTASKDGAVGLEKQANALKLLTGYSDEEIKMAMAMLATFQLNERQIAAAIPRVLDMAAATERLTGQEADLQQIAIAVGKGVTGQVGILSRYGVVISDSVMKTKDFNGILGELDKNFKGAAYTLGTTYTGQVRKMKQAWEDLKETVGVALLPIMKEWTAKLTDFFRSDAATQWANRFVEAAKGVLSVLERIATLVSGLGYALGWTKVNVGSPEHRAFWEGFEEYKARRQAQIRKPWTYTPGFGGGLSDLFRRDRTLPEAELLRLFKGTPEGGLLWARAIGREPMTTETWAGGMATALRNFFTGMVAGIPAMYQQLTTPGGIPSMALASQGKGFQAQFVGVADMWRIMQQQVAGVDDPSKKTARNTETMVRVLEGIKSDTGGILAAEQSNGGNAIGVWGP